MKELLGDFMDAILSFVMLNFGNGFPSLESAVHKSGVDEFEVHAIVFSNGDQGSATHERATLWQCSSPACSHSFH